MSINSQSRLFKVPVFNFSTTCETVKCIQMVLGAREGRVGFVLPSFCFVGNRYNAGRIPRHIQRTDEMSREGHLWTVTFQELFLIITCIVLQFYKG